MQFLKLKLNNKQMQLKVFTFNVTVIIYKQRITEYLLIFTAGPAKLFISAIKIVNNKTV